MQTENRLFDDLVRVMNGAAGTLAGMTREAQASFQERVKEWIGGMDFVGRDEFEAVKAMAITALDENEVLRARIAALEAAAAPAPAASPEGPTLDKGGL
jgi:BMFP domain-containing protein YqiC